MSHINEKVAAGVEQEPNTAFVDFTLPVGEEIFQTKHAGHPNCRGDRIMASRVLEVLYDRKAGSVWRMVRASSRRLRGAAVA